MNQTSSKRELTAEECGAVRRFGRWIQSAAVLSFFIISVGSLVRATNSGLACPDWPLCFGKAIPAFDFHIFVEWFHRLIAGGLTILILGATVMVFRKPVLRRLFGFQLVAATILLAVQIVLGGLTVLDLLDPATVSAHLINAMLFFTLLVWMALRARAVLNPPAQQDSWTAPRHLKVMFTLLTVTVLAQIAVGGMVSTNHAGLVCLDFPTCRGSWWPAASFLVWLQMGHRYLGFAVALLAFALRAVANPTSLPAGLRGIVRFMPTLIVLQIGLGIINVVAMLPTWASVTHLANATFIYTLALIGTVQVMGYPSVEAQTMRFAAAPSPGKQADGSGVTPTP